MKKTKIIVTLGPSSDDPKMIKKLIKAGANVFRLNFSHGTHETHIKNIKKLRKIEKELKTPIAIMQDLQGPKIRVGELPEGKMSLMQGKEVTLTVGKALEGEIPVQYKGIVKDVKKGDRVLLDDGNLELKVTSKSGDKIKCKIVVGGELLSKKGINLPDSDVALHAFSDKDKADLMVGLNNDVDFIALSFVKTGSDIVNLKKLIKSKGKETKVIAKIERHEAVENLDDITEKSDGVMVARGDLGIEISLDRVPFIQKDITKRCIAHGKPVIVAKQMLDSMIRNPRSTRAETSDIANAILDGADAVMLSGETSIGKYPLNAVKAMNKIALTAEKWALDKNIFIGRSVHQNIGSTAEAIAKAAGFNTMTEAQGFYIRNAAYQKSKEHKEDVNHWYRELKKHILRKGITNDELTFSVKVWSEAWRTFGNDDASAKQIILSNLRRDVQSGDDRLYKAIMRSMDIPAPDETRKLINALPNIDEEKRGKLMDTLDFIDSYREED